MSIIKIRNFGSLVKKLDEIIIKLRSRRIRKINNPNMPAKPNN